MLIIAAAANFSLCAICFGLGLHYWGTPTIGVILLGSSVFSAWVSLALCAAIAGGKL